MINFAKGHPNRQLLPLPEIQEIFKKVTQNEESLTNSLNYPKSDPGDPAFLAELRSFMERQTKDDDLGISDPSITHPTSLFTTAGVSHGLDMLCATQTTPGDVALMEQPTYFLAAGIFQSHGLQVQSLPMKMEAGSGVDMDRLEEQLEDGALPVPRMIYVIPTHQNPTARVMPIEDRWKLAKLARKHGILVVADEVYHLLDWRDKERDGLRPARMAALDNHLSNDVDGNTNGHRPGCSVTVSSFTKVFAPGVRCGWVEGPEFITQSLTDLGYIQSQGGCTPLIGELMRISLAEGIGDRVLANLNAAFRQRSERLCQILGSDEGIRFDTVPLGGYFVWVCFDGVDDTSEFLEYCSERGVRFLPGERCHIGSKDGDAKLLECRKWARFCFADLDMNDIEDGAKLLVECYREYLGKRPKM